MCRESYGALWRSLKDITVIKNLCRHLRIFCIINMIARVTLLTPIQLMFCAKTHLMGEIAAFIKYVTRLDFETFIGFMQCWKQNTLFFFLTEINTGCIRWIIFRAILTDSFSYLFILFSSPYSSLPLLSVLTGYGFVDFDSPAAAQKAVASLKASGVQAQMAKVSVTPPLTLCSALLVVIEVFGFHVVLYTPGRLSHSLKTPENTDDDVYEDGWLSFVVIIIIVITTVRSRK